MFLKKDKTVILRNTHIYPNPRLQIVWIRHTRADLGKPDLLTVGKTTYIGDSRFRSSFNWMLGMQDLHITDCGDFFCQIVYHPSTVLHYTVIISGKAIWRDSPAK